MIIIWSSSSLQCYIYWNNIGYLATRRAHMLRYVHIIDVPRCVLLTNKTNSNSNAHFDFSSFDVYIPVIRSTVSKWQCLNGVLVCVWVRERAQSHIPPTYNENRFLWNLINHWCVCSYHFHLISIMSIKWVSWYYSITILIAFLFHLLYTHTHTHVKL